MRIWHFFTNSVIRGLIVILAGVFSVPASGADPRNGVTIYNRHCAQCHGENGVARMPGVPDFTRPEGLMKSDREIAELIREGRSVMPAFAGILSNAEIRDVIAYLRTLNF